MRDKIARERIDGLYNELQKVNRGLQYYDKDNNPIIGLPPARLTAYDIFQRFDELYEFLGIERTTLPPQTFLKKKEPPKK